MKAEDRTGSADKVVDCSTAAGDEKECKRNEDGSTILKNILAYFKIYIYIEATWIYE